MGKIQKLQARVDNARLRARSTENAATDALSRLGLGRDSSGSNIGSRKYDDAFGYLVSDQTYNDYKRVYDRGDIAKRIVDGIKRVVTIQEHTQ